MYVFKKYKILNIYLELAIFCWTKLLKIIKIDLL